MFDHDSLSIAESSFAHLCDGRGSQRRSQLLDESSNAWPLFVFGNMIYLAQN